MLSAYTQFRPPARQDKTVLSVVSGGVNWVGPTARLVRSASECVRRSHRQCLRRPTHSDAERTCRSVGPTQFTPPHQTRQDGPVCVVSGVPVWIGRLLWTRADFNFFVGDSLQLSEIQLNPPKRKRHRQDSFVASGVAVWISFKRSLTRRPWRGSSVILWCFFVPRCSMNRVTTSCTILYDTRNYWGRKCAENYNKWHNNLFLLNCYQHFGTFKP